MPLIVRWSPPMAPFILDAGTARLIREFKLPQTLGFGQCMAPVMLRADCADGRWGPGRLLPYGPIPVDPAAKVLHYAQSVFEGLKAYHVKQPRPALFRPEMNWSRFNTSAIRMMMPELPKNLFLEGVLALTACCEPLIPRAPGQSLYLRPLLFGTQATLGLALSRSHTFLVIASICDALITAPLRILVERDGTRAARGGTGNVKVSGNYGASLSATAAAMALGFDQPLWLDAESHRYVEELSVMNFFAVIDGALHTPALTGTILPGITRASVMELARAAGLPVHERQMDIDELLHMIKSGRCSEAFACGTAVTIGPISAIGERDGSLYPLREPAGPVTRRLREQLLDIQEGRAPDTFGWMHPVAPEEAFSTERN